MIIAIDGPAASGKGTIARQIAAVYGLQHLDTGLLYRAVAKAASLVEAARSGQAAVEAAGPSMAMIMTSPHPAHASIRRIPESSLQ